MPSEYDRLFGSIGKIDSFGDFSEHGLFIGHVQVYTFRAGFRIAEDSRIVLYILWNVNNHRSRPSGSGNLERIEDDASQLFHISYQIRVFGDRKRNSRNIGLLKRIRSDD